MDIDMEQTERILNDASDEKNPQAHTRGLARAQPHMGSGKSKNPFKKWTEKIVNPRGWKKPRKESENQQIVVFLNTWPEIKVQPIWAGTGVSPSKLQLGGRVYRQKFHSQHKSNKAIFSNFFSDAMENWQSRYEIIAQNWPINPTHHQRLSIMRKISEMSTGKFTNALVSLTERPTNFLQRLLLFVDWSTMQRLTGYRAIVQILIWRRRTPVRICTHPTPHIVACSTHVRL